MKSEGEGLRLANNLEQASCSLLCGTLAGAIPLDNTTARNSTDQRCSVYYTWSRKDKHDKLAAPRALEIILDRIHS